VLVAGLSAGARSSSGVADLAEHRTRVSAELEVTDDPRVTRAATTGPGMVVIAARTLRIQTSDGGGSRAGSSAGAGGGGRGSGSSAGSSTGRTSLTLAERQPVLVLVTGDGDSDGDWLGLLPSQRFIVDGGLIPARSGDVAAVLFVRGPPREVRPPTALHTVAGTLRLGLRESAAVLPDTTAGLLPALVVGDTSRLDQDVRADFRAAGMSHLTAVSGANVAIVVGVALALARSGGLGQRSRAAWAATALVAFVVLARPSASVLRAGAMGMIGIVAAGCGRPRQAIPALSATVVVLVLTDPDLALSAGFALSVFATAGMLLLAPGWSEAFARWMPSWLAAAVAVATAAQLACSPVLAWIGGGVSLVAIPANVFALPAVPVATVLGVLVAATAVVCDPLAELLARLAGLPCAWLVGVARVAAGVPGGSVGWPAGPAGAVGLTALTLLTVAAVRRRAARRALAAGCVGVLAAQILVVPRLVPAWPPPGWHLVACDVGQGDALVLRAGDGVGVLIDGGPAPEPLQACLDDLGIVTVPYIVVSHLHADHVDGLGAVLGRLPVGAVLVGPYREPRDRWQWLEATAARAGVPVVEVRAGDRREVGEVSWTTLAPSTAPPPGTNPNDASLVLHALVGGISVLLTGDITQPSQQQLLRNAAPADLAVEVLKVPHHGSADQEPSFLLGTGARFGLVSVGAGNTYGHPAPATLDLLTAAGMAVARTDTNGAVAVVGGSSDGNGGGNGRAATVTVDVVTRRRAPP
jgi:competence protein ComEC